MLKMLARSEILIDSRLCIDPMYIGINVTNFFSTYIFKIKIFIDLIFIQQLFCFEKKDNI